MRFARYSVTSVVLIVILSRIPVLAKGDYSGCSFGSYGTSSDSQLPQRKYQKQKQQGTRSEGYDFHEIYVFKSGPNDNVRVTYLFLTTMPYR